VTDGLDVPPSSDEKPEMVLPSLEGKSEMTSPPSTSPEVPVFEESSENSTEPEVYNEFMGVCRLLPGEGGAKHTICPKKTT